MMTFIFVVCYGFLAFATAVFIYGACLKRTNLIGHAGFKKTIVFFSLLWPLYWAVTIVMVSIHLIKKAVKFCGEKVAKYL